MHCSQKFLLQLTIDKLVLEINTSTILGLFKEIVVDRSIRGEPLEDNIVVVAACNPNRDRLAAQYLNKREIDLGKDWASGHYQVAALPASMDKLKWTFGALSSLQEKEFVLQRLQVVGDDMSLSSQMLFTEIITESQQAMRTLAEQSILENLKRVPSLPPGSNPQAKLNLEADASSRATSVVSLRDIQRVFGLYKFFAEDFTTVSTLRSPDRDQKHSAMLLAIATVYLLRLDSKGRKQFLHKIDSLVSKVPATGCLQSVIDDAMDVVVENTDIPQGIAVTRGLKENIFMTLVCSLSQTPLLIIGPPGSSKTLSVNVVSDNANGEDSSREFYRRFARLSIFHYQCSRQSTSREIASVFEKAVQRQEKVDTARHRCVVFMDEAGLPEEEKESLKVLHYLLEGHMLTKAKVGFIGISNHALDAAKSNRCVTLLRQEPDDDEMLSITTGVLFATGSGKVARVSQVNLDDGLMDTVEFSSRLSTAYASLLHDKVSFEWFESFFGLRDYIHFLKALRLRGSVEGLIFRLPYTSFIFAMERNFNGIEPQQLQQICLAFLRRLTTNADLLQMTAMVVKMKRHPMDVLYEAATVSQVAQNVSERARFKLIIDCTDDDSIIRLLGTMGVVKLSSKSLFMLSQMPEESEMEQLRLVSGVKFAALQGKLAVLSQTHAVNECFYDLFNQHFRAVHGRSGEISLFANIAVGGVSRRSQIRQKFDCIVHVRESQMDQMPAPFLNRFEKYRLRTSDVLGGGCRMLGKLSHYLMKAHEQVARLVSVLGPKGLFGFVDGQTIDSIFINMLPRADSTNPVMLLSTLGEIETNSFSDLLCGVFSEIMSQNDITEHVKSVIEAASSLLPANLSTLLRELRERPTMEADFIQNCLGCLLTKTQDESQMGKLVATLFQMAATRIAAFRLMQIATPESVFSRR